MRRYLLGSFGVSLFLVILKLFEHYLPWDFHIYFPWIVGFFFLQSLFISWILFLGEKNNTQFPNFVIGSLVIRFVTSIFLLLVFFVFGLENRVSFVVQFVAVYLSYLIFELTIVLTNLRRIDD